MTLRHPVSLLDKSARVWNKNSVSLNTSLGLTGGCAAARGPTYKSEVIIWVPSAAQDKTIHTCIVGQEVYNPPPAGRT